ncbi:putative Zn-dependent peptidase [Pedobacter psychrotolerans]|uniref:Peptidase M16 n=1 Tax=Pedobacter psychrotolerans TaxID=1843235 RepID=A0A4R2HBU2_9SPHI|nr:pitrilysin family protein [Pedobacter psychrotolerans]TCO25116.1 putative Zn-dependent peptidase [Pedobacter psychrotolerans]GGE47991.1 peptidase M16 [Pedobacter psychrotolerans]
MLNRQLAPDFKQVSTINFIQPTQQALNNSIPVYTIYSGEQDLVRIEFIFNNVNWNVEKPLQAIAVSAMLNNGTSKLSAKDIAEQIDFYGAFFQTEYVQDHSTVTLYTLNKHLASVLPIVKNVLADSQFPQAEIDIYIQNQKQKLQVNLQKNDILARKEFAHALFGDTAYGVDIQAKHYDELKREDLISYFRSAYAPDNCTIVVSGKFEEASFHLLNEQFGRNWELGKALKNKFNFSLVPRTAIYKDRPDALQSAIRIGKLAVNRTHEDFPGLQILNTVLGGYFGSRLMNNIREDKGYTYGIGSGISSLQDAGYLFIATEVGAEVCSAALTEIYKEIELLKNELVGEEELTLVKNYMLGSMLGSLENVFSHADKFKNIHFFGLGYDYYENYIKKVKSITAEEIRALAIKYFNKEDFTEVVVGKK